MKTIRIVISMLLIALCVAGWTLYFRNVAIKNEEYNVLVAEADALSAKGLFQRAVQSYEEALALHEDAEVRSRWLSAYQQGYELSLISRSQYTSALEHAVKQNPKNVDNWESLVSCAIEAGRYDEANSALRRADRAGVSSRGLEEMRIIVRYSYTTSGLSYIQYTKSLNGQFSVYDGLWWGLLNANGDAAYKCEYGYISPVSDSGERVVRNKESTYLEDENGIIEAYLTVPFERALAYGDGCLPVKIENRWRYLLCEEDKLAPAEYLQVSSFVNGIAAVQEPDGWHLIDRGFSHISETVFDDVKLHEDGRYLYDGIMVASVGGYYGLYSDQGKKICDFECDNMDVYLGEAIAFQSKSEEWGFVNTDGSIVIEPSYMEAKSFSDGLAPVCLGDSWGVINNNGTLVIEAKFADVGHFNTDGVCMVSDIDTGVAHILKMRYQNP